MSSGVDVDVLDEEEAGERVMLVASQWRRGTRVLLRGTSMSMRKRRPWEGPVELEDQTGVLMLGVWAVSLRGVSWLGGGNGVDVLGGKGMYLGGGCVHRAETRYWRRTGR